MNLTTDAQLHAHDERRYMREGATPLRSSADMEASIRRELRLRVSEHLAAIRHVGLTRMDQLSDRLRGDIAFLRRQHTQSVGRERKDSYHG